MTRITRKLLRCFKNIGIISTTGIFAVSLNMWVRSSSREDTLAYCSKDGTGFNFSITSAGGILSLEQFPGGFEDIRDPPNIRRHFEFDSNPRQPRKIYGIGWAPADKPFFRRFYFDFNSPVFIAMPYWALGALTGIVPVSWLLNALRRKRIIKRRKREGLCPICGYDMRATPMLCPECGYRRPKIPFGR